MSAQEFRAALEATGVSVAWLAKATGRSKSAFRRWMEGTARPPPTLMNWLVTRASNPPPMFRPDPRKKNLP